MNVKIEHHIEPAISRLAKERAQGLILLSSSWFVTERQRLVRLARQHRWPLIASAREFAEAGALLSYGVDRTALFRRAAYYVDRILKGAAGRYTHRAADQVRTGRERKNRESARA